RGGFLPGRRALPDLLDPRNVPRASDVPVSRLDGGPGIGRLAAGFLAAAVGWLARTGWLAVAVPDGGHTLGVAGFCGAGRSAGQACPRKVAHGRREGLAYGST